ncbi:DHA2 family efflux MFS transporter permease subunit [Zavarzinia sp. CC-PAN008]|uniref:DHA2 family efflux MFS transporter permease subunit n=1 Tax=Zavarzinia sp. CC-PAN008 TaxID=3243332 RepID=UPI003F748709
MIVGSALFMQLLDSTVIATALPSIAQSIGADAIRLNLAITSYLLSVAVFIPISGWAADRWGARTVFTCAIAIFTGASVLCGLSNSLAELVMARILQGLGGAMMVPVGRLVVLRSVPKANLVQAMTWLTIPAVLGPVLGPPIGGFIVTYGSWRWIFFMNVPFGILGIVLALRFIANLKEPGRPPLDVLGFFLSGIALAALVFGFEAVGRAVLPPAAVAALLVGGLAAALLYARHARRTAHPIVDLSLFRVRTFAISTLGGNLSRIGLGALPFLLAMLFQLAFGLSAFEAGMLTFVSAVGALGLKFAAPPIMRRFGFRRVLIANTWASAAILAGYALFQPTTPHVVILVALFVGGFSRSLQMTAVNTLTYADIGQERMSGASSLASMAQQLGISIGVGVAALVLHLMIGDRSGQALTTADVAPAFIVIAVLTLCSLPFFHALPAGAGEEVSGHREKPDLAPKPAE